MINTDFISVQFGVGSNPITHKVPKTTYQVLCDKVSELFKITAKFHFIHIDEDGDQIAVDCENDMKFVTPATLLHLAIDPVVQVRDYRDVTKIHELPKTSYQALCDKVSELFQLKTQFHFIHIDEDGDQIAVDCENDMKFVKPATLLHLAITPSSTPFFTVANLMERFSKSWIAETGEFDFSNDPFDLERLTTLFKRHEERFRKEGIDYKDHFGFIEKIDLDPEKNPKIYMRADLHGDLKSLLENLRSLQVEGLLDQNFRCTTGFHLVFLGDYCDRGAYGTQILELLASLQMENPEQVHLIRGNHESSLMNNSYCGLDERLRAVCFEIETREALEKFYETMPLTTYISLAVAKSREYVQCTHGLFELTTDPFSLLDDEASYAYIPVSKVRKLSDRIKKMKEGKTELALSALRIRNLFKAWKHSDSELTAYNWGDVSQEESSTGYLSTRDFALNALDIKHYFNLSSDRHNVKMLFRGRQHLFQNLMHDNAVIATTLPVGVDCPALCQEPDPTQNPDKAYVITPKMKVEDWIKYGLIRYSKQQATDVITAGYPLISKDI